MLPEEIIEIIQKYQNDIPDEISSINTLIDEMLCQLKSISKRISSKLYMLINNESINDEEDNILQDSKIMRKYINSIEFLPGKFKDDRQADNGSSTFAPEFDFNVYPYLISELFCPFDLTELKPCTIHYQENVNNKIENKTIQGYKCFECNKIFLMDDEISEVSFDNTNINIIKNKIPQIDIYSVVVLSNTLKCSSNHKTKDILAKIPCVTNEGDIKYHEINASYCFDCKRFSVLKNDFNSIKDIAICKVIDETTEYESSDSEMDIEQKKSVLYSYGYNVQSQINLSEKQRHIILASVIEANILNRRKIIDHITTLIERGSKRPNWKDATDKWKEDREFVQNYKLEDLPSVIFDKIILRYSKQKEH